MIYSVATYLLRAPGISLLLLAIAQAGAVAFTLTMLRSQIAPRSSFALSTAVAAAVAFLTSAAWYAAYVVPDILAGVAIASAAILTLFFDRIGLITRLALVMLIGLLHQRARQPSSNRFRYPRGGRCRQSVVATAVVLATGLRRALWFLSPIIIAVIALLSTSYLAFGELSLAPKRYPIQLARSVADGPGAWHLRDHCATERYAICEIFGPNPPRRRRRIPLGRGRRPLSRDTRADGADPRRGKHHRPSRGTGISWPSDTPIGDEHVSTADHVRAGRFDLRIRNGRAETTRRASVQPPTGRPSSSIGQLLIYFGFVGAFVLLFVMRRRLQPTEIAAVAVVSVGLLANAAVCGSLSGVTDRYQGRVAWVLPALALIILLRVGLAASQPPPTRK